MIKWTHLEAFKKQITSHMIKWTRLEVNKKLLMDPPRNLKQVKNEDTSTE